MTNTGGQPPKAMMPTSMKYNCMASGEKRANPCASCPSSSVCMTDAMQIKESDKMKKKAVVKIDADGELVKCAVGAGDDCGYRAGAKVCQKCGAMALQSKESIEDEDDEEMEDDEMSPDAQAVIDMMDDDDEEDDDEVKAMWAAEDDEDDERLMLQPAGKKMKKSPMMAMAEEVDDEDLEDDEEYDDEKGYGMGSDMDDVYMGEARKRRVREKFAGMGSDMDDTLMGESRKKKIRQKFAGMGSDMDDTLMGESRKKKMRGKEYGMGSDMDDTLMGDARRKKMRGKRLADMGMKSDSIDVSDLYICQDTREVKSLHSHDCGNCSGACYSVAGEPDLLDIEAAAEDTLNGKALYSYFSEAKNLFTVRMERKDGQVIDAFYTGEGELDGWFRVTPEELEQEASIKSLEIATKSALSVIDGTPGEVAITEFEGLEAYSIEIDGLDGKSYDVYVDPIDGEVLGYDEYEWIDSELDEKRDYSTEQRDELAEIGLALPDGSFPIKDEEDLKNAIQAFGRAKDKEVAKIHIMKRAAELDKEDLIPENWGNEEKSLEAALMEFELLAAEEELRDILKGDN